MTLANHIVNPCPWKCPICGRCCNENRGHKGSHICWEHSIKPFRAWEEYAIMVSHDLAVIVAESVERAREGKGKEERRVN